MLYQSERLLLLLHEWRVLRLHVDREHLVLAGLRDRYRLLLNEVSLRLPEPPSANRWWRMGRSGQGRAPRHMILSREARAYLAAVQMLVGGQVRPIAAERQWPLFPKGTEVALEVKWYRCRRAGDLDKRLGVLLDALQGTLYAKDAQIAELHAFRLDTDGPEGYVLLRAWAASAPALQTPAREAILR